MHSPDEFHKKVELSLGVIVWWTTLLITLTFSAATIYWNFTALQMEAEITNNRSNKRYNRLVEIDNDHEQRLRIIEKSNLKIELMEKELAELNKNKTK